LANDDELVAVAPHGSVIIETVGKLRITADHVSGLHDRPGHRVVNAAAIAGDFGAGNVHDTFLGVVHHADPLGNALRYDRAAGDGTIHVERLDPVVVPDTGHLRIFLAHPDNGAAATERQHEQVVGIGRVNAPLLVRREPVQHD